MNNAEIRISLLFRLLDIGFPVPSSYQDRIYAVPDPGMLLFTFSIPRATARGERLTCVCWNVSSPPPKLCRTRSMHESLVYSLKPR